MNSWRKSSQKTHDPIENKHWRQRDPSRPKTANVVNLFQPNRPLMISRPPRVDSIPIVTANMFTKIRPSMPRFVLTQQKMFNVWLPALIPKKKCLCRTNNWLWFKRKNMDHHFNDCGCSSMGTTGLRWQQYFKYYASMGIEVDRRI